MNCANYSEVKNAKRVNQVDSEARSLKSLKKWFDIS